MPNEENGETYDSQNTYSVGAIIIYGSIYSFVTWRFLTNASCYSKSFEQLCRDSHDKKKIHHMDTEHLQNLVYCKNFEVSGLQ